MRLPVQRLPLSALTVAAFLASGSATGAQTFPDHVVKIIVPTAPGGAIDTTARVIGEKMQQKWGKPVVIENRPGAAMQVGAEAVAKAPPDGYTLLIAHDGTMAINPLIFSHLHTIRKRALRRSGSSPLYPRRSWSMSECPRTRSVN